MAVNVDPVMQSSARFLALPTPMQKEYAAFERFALTMLLWEPISIKTKHGGNIQRFMEWLWITKGRNTTIGITAAECIEYITQSVGEKKLAHETIKKYRTSLLSYMHWQFNEGTINSDEILRLERVKVSKKRRHGTKPVRSLKRVEMANVFQTIDTRWPYDAQQVDRFARGIRIGPGSIPALRASFANMQRFTVIMLALHTGMRRQEIFNLKVKDVDPRNSTIYIIGKGGKPRHCMYPEVLREQMYRYLAHRALVVGDQHDDLWFSMHGEWGRQVSFDAFRKWIKPIFGDIDAGWHILRKTFATTCDRLNMPVGEISELLGHADEKTTRIYLERDRHYVIETTQAYEHALADKFAGVIPPRPHERAS